MVEDLDARARNHAAATELPPANVLTSSFTHNVRTDPAVFTRLVARYG